MLLSNYAAGSYRHVLTRLETAQTYVWGSECTIFTAPALFILYWPRMQAVCVLGHLDCRAVEASQLAGIIHRGGRADRHRSWWTTPEGSQMRRPEGERLSVDSQRVGELGEEPPVEVEGELEGERRSWGVGEGLGFDPHRDEGRQAKRHSTHTDR